MKNDKSLMEFPCDFQIKIIGINRDTFEAEVAEIARKHFPGTNDTAIRKKHSQQGNYLAITLTVHVLDQTTLDALYRELTKHPDIKMVL